MIKDAEDNIIYKCNLTEIMDILPWFWRELVIVIKDEGDPDAFLDVMMTVAELKVKDRMVYFICDENGMCTKVFRYSWMLKVPLLRQAL